MKLDLNKFLINISYVDPDVIGMTESDGNSVQEYSEPYNIAYIPELKISATGSIAQGAMKNLFDEYEKINK